MTGEPGGIPSTEELSMSAIAALPSPSLSLHDHSDSLPAADTKRRKPAVHLTTLHLIQKRDQHSRAACSNRMSERDCAAVYVYVRSIQTELRYHGEALSRKCLVQLKQVDITYLKISFFECAFDRGDRTKTHVSRINARRRVRNYFGQRVELHQARSFLAHDDHRGRAVVDTRSIPCC